jgi:hypothetical protein
MGKNVLLSIQGMSHPVKKINQQLTKINDEQKENSSPRWQSA